MEKKTKAYIVILYLIEIVIGIFYVSRFTIPVHSHVDEELYLAMAKSFHYGHGFMQYGNILNYKAVLYSCVISVAYYFYDPEYILFYVRIINVVIMGSAIFPAYKLADKVITDRNKAIMATLLISIVPEMAMTGYIMQEILYYPLLLWAFYLMYMDIRTEGVSLNTVLTPVLYMLVFFTKTVGFIFPLLYAGYLLIKSLLSKKDYLKILINTMICAVMYLAESGLINLINGGSGSNHYSSQVANLFPITLVTVRCLVVGVLFYAACTFISMGVFAIAVPVKKIREYKAGDKEFCLLLMCFLIASIVEIIVLVVYTEHRDFLYPAKYLYRYVFPILAPLFILMIEGLDLPVNKFSSKIGLVIIGRIILLSSIVLLIYYLVARTDIASGIVDGLLFTTLTNAVNHVWRYSGIVFAAILLLIAITILYLCRTTNAEDYRFSFKTVVSLYAIYFIVFDIINFVQLPYYNNVICNGDLNEKQFIEIARWLNSNEHDNVIYVCSGYEPENSLWGYIRDDYSIYTYEEYISECDNKEVEDGSVIIIDKNSAKEYALEFGEELYSTNDYWIMLYRKNGL